MIKKHLRYSRILAEECVKIHSDDDARIHLYHEEKNVVKILASYQAGIMNSKFKMFTHYQN